MKPGTSEWVDKAEQDFSVARGVMRRKQPAYDTVCFLCQQSAEKYLKARLYEAGITFPKTHDCTALLQLLLPIEPLWAPWDPTLRSLNDYAVKFRYPGHTATRHDGQQALKDSKAIRKVVRLSLGLRIK